jgi:enterochelin esterase-like enzyme
VEIEVHRLVWHGRADGLAVKTFMPRFPHHLPMRSAPDGWWVDIHMPASARIEYRFEIRRGDRYETTLDPANPVVATNPFGETSVLFGSTYPRLSGGDDLIGWRHSEFRVQSVVFGARRHHHLLSPVGVPDRKPLPLLVLHDGSDYRKHAGLEDVLGAAVSAGRLPPLRVVLLQPRKRNVEYAADPRHAGHVVDEVLPHLRARIGIGTRRVIGGASLGAVASWHVAHSHPGVFTGMALQSGTFAVGPHPELPSEMASPIESFLRQAYLDPRAAKISVGQTCGAYESLVDWNRAVAGLLEEAAASHRYVERWTGHDWGAWSDTLVDAVAAGLGHGHPASVAAV